MTDKPYIDPRPWSCVNCGDRFARDQTHTGSVGHTTNYKPRTEKPQKRPRRTS